MRKPVTLLPIVLGISIFLTSCSTASTVEAQEISQPVSDSIISEGVVLPVRTVDLGFYPNGGMVGEIAKAAGDEVESGEMIAKLILTLQQAAAVKSAEQELLLAQNTLQTFLDEVEVSKTQAGYDLALAREAFNKAMDKKRDKEHTYKYSKTRESKVELEKALTNYDLTQAQVALAEKELVRWENGPDPVKLSELNARVTNAEAQLASARAAATDQLVLAAPWDGIVVTNDLVVGQTVQAGTTHVKLADQSEWIVETNDLTEIDISTISIGQTATVRVDALPGKAFTGTITAIEGIGVDKQGDITYKVTLEIENDLGLKWNMTASVEFDQ